ncbi:chorismate synthase [Limosilactobacillus antri]|uniref:Chorismate synthase n=1 Tax=Limosilactobacillus antri DSM 16041 TaxID=525309 RepID=C8P8M4_9LACO|nr:chorismate synthase [Limosilactobacillus antri]EEW53163.1 chorismate synthase [Limosilactobacillus antri DSM 16041]KRK58862.1 chorismate synthase [Limosilactobacillus antri DSM 16041]
MEYYTAGESHGPQLTGILTGVPAGLKLDVEQINQVLRSRQAGYGRGHRQQIEHDQVNIVGGLRHGMTLGSPLALEIANRDHANWARIMDPLSSPNRENTRRKVERPRPGHADLVGGLKTRHRDLRNVLERSSARETAMRVAIGNVCTQLLAALGIQLVGYVQQIGSIAVTEPATLTVGQVGRAILENDLRIANQEQVAPIHALIDQSRQAGDTLGGQVRVLVENVPAGLGSYASAQAKLDAKIAAAVISVNAIKGVSFGDGQQLGQMAGSQAMDEIAYQKLRGYYRLSNHLGGFEGGMTNGMPLVINATVKPIPTLYHPLQTVDINTKQAVRANVERSDTTAVVPASVIVASVVAIELAKEITATFESANLERLREALARYRQEISEA